jgi:Subtilase family
MSEADKSRPRTFFLNERHELAPEEKSGGGRTPKYAGISWREKSRQISSSISSVLQAVEQSKDPLRERRVFALARPVKTLTKLSTDRKKAPNGTFDEETKFGGMHGRAFDRLGLDLMQVTASGDAVVHGSHERLAQLLSRSESLELLGAREQARWVAIDKFDFVPIQLRVDDEWLESFGRDATVDVVFELQPVLSRVEADQVLRSIADVVSRRIGGRLVATGNDFSGRYWFRGRAMNNSIREIAKEYFSVQSIHPPLFSLPSATSNRRRAEVVRSLPTINPAEARQLPCVAVVDLGVPADHMQLAAYRRGQFVPLSAGPSSQHDHGAFVASRVVFGHYASAAELSSAVGDCSFYDVVVGDGVSNHIDDKIVMDALRGVRGAAPDVRVFNLSFGDYRPLSAFGEVERREKRLTLQDLDNFAFANDVVIVVAAGNSSNGVVPTSPYPGHLDDARWGLGPWACGYNTLVCGSYVSSLAGNGLVKSIGHPSPFTRVGNGLCNSPVPSFCAEGGNATEFYGFEAGLGVWGYSGVGLAEDRAGTSNAAPVLAREAAIGLSVLQEYCPAGARPFAVTVRAFLALTASPTTTDAHIAALTERTLGYGRPSAERMRAPRSGSAVIIWQGVIESSRDVLRVQIPVPRQWIAEAGEPVLRLFVCYDPPVNESAGEYWACRTVSVTLHPGPEARGLRAPARAHATYPLFSREYKLRRSKKEGEEEIESDLWLFELKYEEVFDYPPGMDFDPRQRVAIAGELVDLDENPVDPQPALQGLPASAAMTRLSVQPTPIRQPVILRSTR